MISREQIAKIKDLAEAYAMATRYVVEAEKYLEVQKDARTNAWGKLNNYLETENLADEIKNASKLDDLAK